MWPGHHSFLRQLQHPGTDCSFGQCYDPKISLRGIRGWHMAESKASETALALVTRRPPEGILTGCKTPHGGGSLASGEVVGSAGAQHNPNGHHLREVLGN